VAVEVKSVSQILADMVRRITAETELTDVNAGSVLATLLEAAAISDYQNQVSILKILESTRLESLVGADLDTKAIEMNIPNGQGGIGRIPASRSSGVITVGSSFVKKSTEFYLGKPAPFSGTLTLYLQEASGWPPSGQIYIGRGSGNEEGPLSYTSISDQGTYFAMILSPSTPLLRAHRYDEQVVLSQGGIRSVPAGTRLLSPAVDNTPQVEFVTDAALTLLDGESSGDIRATCTQFGEQGNVVAGAITVFSSVPFSGATVTNGLSFVNGSAAESDESLRQRIKNYPATLSKGTRSAIAAALQNLRDPVSGKTITSLNIVEPTASGEMARCYIDDGSGLEPAVDGQPYEDLLSSANGQEILFKTAKAPVTSCLATGTNMGPFQLPDGGKLLVTLDGITESFTINSSDFVNLNAVSAAELVNSLNNQGVNIAFRTAGGGKYISLFDISGAGEILQVNEGSVQRLLGLPVRQIRPIYLFKNNDLLSFKGSTATLTTAAYPWYSQSVMSNVQVIVDGVTQTFSVVDSDFAVYGATAQSASLDQWAAVLKKKIAGVNVYTVDAVGGGSALVWETWQANSVNGSLEVIPSDAWRGVGKMWSATQKLSAVGAGADFEFNRLLGQIRLSDKPKRGDSITLASEQTRAQLLSGESTTGTFAGGATNVGNPRIFIGVDGEFAIRAVGYTSGSVFAVTAGVGSNVVKLQTTEYVAVANIQVGDYVWFVRDTNQVYPVPVAAEGFYLVKKVSGDLSSGGFIEIQTDDTIASSFLSVGTVSIASTAYGAFLCKGAVPQVVDFGNVAIMTADDIVSSCAPQVVGASVVKVSPQQFAIRSNSFMAGSSIACFAVVGAAQGFFAAGLSTGIQPHVGYQVSSELRGGFAKVQSVVGETASSGFYPRRGYLKIGAVSTDVISTDTDPLVKESSLVVDYPVGLQEVQITGRNLDNTFRVYNNTGIAPFDGFVRGKGVLKPQLQSTITSGNLGNNIGLRLEDLPFGSAEKLVVEMNQDAVSGTSAVPLYKRANIWTMDAISGGKGSLSKFTLTDPDDNDLYFFDPASPFRDFDFSDFNILFKSIGLYDIYPEDIGTKLPDFTNKNTLMFQSREYGPAYRPCLSVVYGQIPNVAVPSVTHKTYMDGGVVKCHLYVTLPTGAVRGSFSGGYSVTFADYLGHGGSSLVEMTLQATTVGVEINPGVTDFVVGDILNLGGTGAYAGSYLITASTSTTVKAVAPGLRRSSYGTVLFDSTLTPLSGIQKVDYTMGQLAVALSDYLSDNPVVTARVLSVDDSVKVLYPTYFTQGSSVVNTEFETMAEYYDLHAACGHHGSVAHVYLYRRLDESFSVVDEIRALCQYDDSLLLSASEIEPSMNYTYRGEDCLLVPANTAAVSRWLSFASVSSLPLRADVALVDAVRGVQINSSERGSSGAVTVSGITANTVSDTIKTVPSVDSSGFLRANISYVLSQAMPRGTLVEITNDFATPISRAYSSMPVLNDGVVNSAVTTSNDTRTGSFFRDTTNVSYVRPEANRGTFIFQRSASGYLASGVNNIEITKVNSHIARVSVPAGSGNVLRARTGDMFVISQSSAALEVNKCVDLPGEYYSDVYTGYPVVHVASDTEIYVIGENLVDDLFALSSEDDLMFVPHIRHEKNIRTNYKSCAKFTEKVSPSEGLYYRLKRIGGGFVYCEFANDTEGVNLDMQLDGLSVSTDDWVYFSAAFLPQNRGTFKIVAHNGRNAMIFKNDDAVDEVLSASVDGLTYGTDFWGIGPVTDSSVTTVDRRHVRIWDVDSVSLADRLVISSPASSTSTWFAESLIGSWPISEIGLTGVGHVKGQYHVYVKASVTNAPASNPDVLLSSSVTSVGFMERDLGSGSTRILGYKWVTGYAPSPVDSEQSDIYLSPTTSYRRMLPEYGTSVRAMFKMNYPVGTNTGVDAYQYYTELIAESHKVLDGSAENPIDYPGVRAAGSRVEVLAPLIKSVYLTLDITPREGVTISSIKAPVRSVVSSYINGLGVGREVVKSEVIKRTQQVPGVKSVTVVATIPSSTNGIISVGSFEVARILDPNNISI
jgi:hypothetical protein